ncbi:hypothetical protein [Actinotalea sp. JY-7876]|uniref:hypothetical protein n=1 Tax=Actinotalea sp. JY-7876 TaxID=2758442 RepID=UPI0015F6215C|nr:hypothetical protein [Actinotalea sp. JY-7876]
MVAYDRCQQSADVHASATRVLRRSTAVIGGVVVAVVAVPSMSCHVVVPASRYWPDHVVVSVMA